MKKIIQTFPTVMLEAIIDNEEEINTKLRYEIKNLFENKDTQKRALSHQWEDFVVSADNHLDGYSNFTLDSNLIKNDKFLFFYEHITPLISDFFAQLDYHNEWHFVNSWAAVYPKGAWVPLHDHKIMEWSGVYYVSAPKNCGDIAFTDPKEYALAAEPPNTRWRGNYKQKFNPENGKLILFPSYIKHETVPNQSDEDRIIISFNINTGKENYKFPNL